MNLRYKSAWIHYRVGGHETKCRFPALESLVLHFRNGGFHHTGIDGFHDRTGGVKPSGILNIGIRVVYKVEYTDTVMKIIVISARADEQVYKEANKRKTRHDL